MTAAPQETAAVRRVAAGPSGKSPKKTGTPGNASMMKSLVRSHIRGDSDRFLSIALQLAADAARKGHGILSDDLKALVADGRAALAKAGANDRLRANRVAPNLAGIVVRKETSAVLGDMVLDPRLVTGLRQVVREHGRAEELLAYGLTPRRKLLFRGPPGTGKTMTASALAGELGLPLYVIQLDGLITKFMGETSAKLRLVFDAMNTQRGVYFFDEIDAIAASRTTENDVGEARRILNSLLQMMDEDQSGSVMVAATNHKELLDSASFRRFQLHLDYRLPGADDVRPLIAGALASFDLADVDWTAVAGEADGLSHDDLVCGACDAAREAVLDHDGDVTTDILVRAIREKRASTAAMAGAGEAE